MVVSCRAGRIFRQGGCKIASNDVYYPRMYNWSTNEDALKRDPEKYAIWKLEQAVNFGLNGKKIHAADLKKYWPRLAIDASRKKFLQLLLDEN